MVELLTASAVLLVTASHRIMVKGASGHVEEVEAGALEAGQQVMCRGGSAELLEKRHMANRTKVVEVIFYPDLAVEAIVPPPDTILSKGQAPPLEDARSAGAGAARNRARTRRGGMWKRDQPRRGPDAEPCPVPDTPSHSSLYR